MTISVPSPYYLRLTCAAANRRPIRSGADSSRSGIREERVGLASVKAGVESGASWGESFAVVLPGGGGPPPPPLPPGGGRGPPPAPLQTEGLSEVLDAHLEYTRHFTPAL